LGNETLSSRKCEEFLCYLSYCQLFKKKSTPWIHLPREDKGEDAKILLKLVLRGVDWIYLADDKEPVADHCEHGNGIFDSINFMMI
jgi:hypothetical protein